MTTEQQVPDFFLRRTLHAATALMAIALVHAAPGATTARADDILVRDVGLVDVTTGQVRAKSDILVRGERIAAIGATGSTPPAGARVVEGSGRFAIPGLSEMHAHVPPPAEQRALGEDYLRLYVANGVTTIRGMLGAPWHLQLRDDIAQGRVLGPRFFAGAPSLNGNSAPDAATAQRLVREHEAAGFDFLQLHPGLEREVFDAIVATAREVGITFAGHVSEDVGIEHALAARQSTVDHLDGYLNALADAECRQSRGAGFFAIGLVDCMDEKRIAPLVRQTKEAGTWNVATQSLLDKFAEPPASVEALRARPEMKYMAPQTAANWFNAQRNFAGGQPPNAAQVARFLDLRRKLLHALDAAGAPLLVGADSPQIFNVPGFASHDELASLVRAGISPRVALHAATVNAARLFGREKDFGSLEADRIADLVLLDANPLEDIANTRRIAGVMLRGRWFSRQDLDAMLADVAERAAKR